MNLRLKAVVAVIANKDKTNDKKKGKRQEKEPKVIKTVVAWSNVIFVVFLVIVISPT